MTLVGSPIRGSIRSSPIYSPTVGKGGGVSPPPAGYQYMQFRPDNIGPYMHLLFKDANGAYRPLAYKEA